MAGGYRHIRSVKGAARQLARYPADFKLAEVQDDLREHGIIVPYHLLEAADMVIEDYGFGKREIQTYMLED